MNLLTTLLAFAVTIGILITFHEAGHYLVARLCGVKILRFSIGFGKPLWSWKRKSDPDQTEWSVAAVPLGGYVRMLDERDPECLPIKKEDAQRTFGSRPLWQRFAIVAAGPVANLILAVILYSIIFMAGSVQPLPVVAEPAAETPAALAGIHAGDRILAVDGHTIKTFSDLRMEVFSRLGSSITLEIESPNGGRFERRMDLSGIGMDPVTKDDDPFTRTGLDLNIGQPEISGFVEHSAALAAGMRKGDKVLSVAGQKVRTPAELVAEVRKFPDREIAVELERDGQTLQLFLTPSAVQDAEGKTVGRIGASIAVDYPKTKVSYGFIESIGQGVKKTWDTAVMSVRMMGKMLLGEISVKNISGPVSIADYAGQTAQLGLLPFISFLALVSVSIGILNLLPIPMLDGGHLLYYSVEMIRGKPVSESFQSVAQKAGVIALLGLTALALFNDLTRLLP